MYPLVRFCTCHTYSQLLFSYNYFTEIQVTEDDSLIAYRRLLDEKSDLELTSKMTLRKSLQEKLAIQTQVHLKSILQAKPLYDVNLVLYRLILRIEPFR